MESSKLIFEVLQENVGARIDTFLVEKLPEKSRSNIQKQIEEKNITVNGKQVSKNYKMRDCDVVEFIQSQPIQVDIKPQDIPLEIIYEDSSLLVVNKQRGMVVHPAPGHFENTLVNALMFHCKESLSGINGEIRPGIVHRIDKNTSGLLIVAKNDLAHIGLAKQIKEHTFLREYDAVVCGRVKEERFTIDQPIGRSKNDRKRMCVTNDNARNAVTHVEVIERYEKYTHVLCRLETGRTHQIRVHLAYAGFPLAGDDVYGYKNTIKKLGGQCLHAKTIGFRHPITKEDLYFTSELPQYFTEFLSTLKKD